jgi:hypothetical protein
MTLIRIDPKDKIINHKEHKGHKVGARLIAPSDRRNEKIILPQRPVLSEVEGTQRAQKKDEDN